MEGERAPGNPKSMENAQEILPAGKESISKEFLVSGSMLPLIRALEQLEIKAEKIGLWMSPGGGEEKDLRGGRKGTDWK